jgi:hypothetical protein
VVEVIVTDEFDAWYSGLTEPDENAVYRVVELLAAMGVRLGHPYSSEIKGARMALRELRVQSQGRPLRIFYAFDPHRQAVLLIGGDKTGDDRFYERMVPLAEQIWSQYLAETSK